MAFDQTTRNRLARFVSDARSLLTEEFTRQLQNEFGLDPASGDVTPIERLTALDDRQRETARILRETLNYYLAGNSKVDGKANRDVLDRIVREQAFTVLNRLCALRMSEARGLVLESIAKGYQSKGFQLYARLGGSALGETGEAYQMYLFSLMDEFAVDLPVLFDRFSPQGRLFPREAALLKLLELINDVEIESLWSEDETIGWIYQYFNSKEERKAMRDASQAPRNSRELAVRNQFFTPRYVVEFLTDNTLGRIWYEMTRGETVLKDTCRYLVRRPNEIFLDQGEVAPKQTETDENLSQEELLCQPVYIPHRQLKDPREIKMLDPACGSMHFGLYAFDLFEQIYAEAWELEERLGEDALQRLADLEPLHKTYPDKQTYLKDVPRLIIERNIHGVDIDPRAVQIAGLSLWLRAQKSWQVQGLRPGERPQIRKSNVVCAEPMPGDRQMLEEFLETLRGEKLEALMRKAWHVPADQKVRATPQMADALARLVRTVWQEMELAGEAGSLLKIEETLRGAIAAARKESEEKSPLFRVLEYGLSETPQEKYVQVVAGEDQDFFDRTEGLVLAAIRDYVGQADTDEGYIRRLFAEDTTQGFDFINLCQKRYDVILMNPPFGEFSLKWKDNANKHYSRTSNDMFAAFTERMIDMLLPNSSLGSITSRAGFFLTSFSQWRNQIITNNANLRLLIDLGDNVMDNAMVEAAAYCIDKNNSIENSLFIRAFQVTNRDNVIHNTINRISKGYFSQNVYLTKVSSFSNLPDMPFAYWADANTIKALISWPKLKEVAGDVRQGLATADDYRFARAIWETQYKNRYKKQNCGAWVPYVKAGTSQPWFSPITLLVNWENEGAELWNNLNSSGKVRSNIWMLKDTIQKYFFKPGFSWTRRAVRFIPYVIPEGCIPSASRYLAYPKPENIYSLLGILASNIASIFFRFYGEKFHFPNYMVETVKLLPWPKISDELEKSLKSLISEELNKRRRVYQNHEPFHEFTLPYILWDKGTKPIDLEFSMSTLLGENLDEKISLAYGINRQNFNNLSSDLIEAVTNYLPSDNQDEIKDSKDFVVDNSPLAQYESLISYLIGTIFGRWDVLYAIGKKPIPTLWGPFEILPTCPPGMLQNPQGLPADPKDVPDDYPVKISWSGILVDDEGNHEDIERRVRDALHVIWSGRVEENEDKICHILGVHTVREYFRKPALFFADHLKRYSKSRRAAPIYWPLSTPSCSYTLWLYYHRLNDQTLYTCVNDFVDPKLKQVSEEAARLRSKKGRSAADEKELERLTDFERELKDFREELLRVAKFWKPNLNDGVEITAAPLWKLFQHKPWQKRLKETWQKMEAGEYDWAHLAYSIWPERVREKCKTDKSLAIAHDLEELYVEPPASAKKKKTKKPAIDEETEGWFNED